MSDVDDVKGEYIKKINNIDDNIINTFFKIIKDAELLLITKPEQSGKTFKVLQFISALNKKEEHIDTIHFIICDNSLLQVSQTIERISTHDELSINKDSDTGEFYIAFSSRDTKKKEIIQWHIVDGIRIIVCCSNKVRINDIEEIVIKFKENRLLHNMKFFFWYDEADKHLSYVNTLYNLYQKYKKSTKLILITATPARLFDKYGDKITICPIYDPTSKFYHGFEDNNIIKINESTENLCKYIKYILNIVKICNKIKPGVKFFAPADYTCASHEEVCSIFNSFGFVVLIVNGSGQNLYFPDGTIVKNLEKEGKKTIADNIPYIYKKYGIKEYPFAITGLICISRGVTLMSNNFFFTHGILPPGIKEEADISQLAGRLKGNYKDHKNYAPPTLFCTDRVEEVCLTCEKFPCLLCEHASEKAKEGKLLKISDLPDTVARPKSSVNKKKKEDCTSCAEVPHCIPITKEEYKKIESLVKDKRKKYLLSLIEKLNPELYSRISNYYITNSIPGKNLSKTAKKKSIDPIKNAIKANKKSITGIKDKDRGNKNSANINIDMDDYILYITIWSGKKESSVETLESEPSITTKVTKASDVKKALDDYIVLV